MSESDMRSRIVSVLRPLNAVSVENRVGPGTPDVNFIEGWVELKWARLWPKRGGILVLEHYTPQQKVWGIDRYRSGGNVWCLLQVRSSWLLFDPVRAATYLGRATREELMEHCHAAWLTGLNEKDFTKCISERLNDSSLPAGVWEKLKQRRQCGTA